MPAEKTIYSVSELNRTVRQLIETGLPAVWVEGEISNLARPASGHLYFSLKDSQAQIRCAMFRNRKQLLRFAPDSGMQVLLRGRLSLYEARGDYQMIVEQIEPAGEGLLRRQYEELKTKLEREGLFANARKQSLPALPKRIGIITSPSGAAVRDIISVLRRRMPTVDVVIYPAQVQGAAAADDLLQALQTAIRRNECDTLIIGRGGGSLEDLWAFNDEGLARAIADCPIPIISAVGHEVDFTICDLVVDLRAPTPSVAAEHAVPDQADFLRRLEHRRDQLENAVQRHLRGASQTLDWLQKRLLPLHPGRRLADDRRRLNDLKQRAARAAAEQTNAVREQISRHELRLRAANPAQRIRLQQQALNRQTDRLNIAAERLLSHNQQRLTVTARALQTVSPLATLERGYAIVTNPSGKTLKDANKIKAGDRLTVRLARGELDAEVLEKNAKP